MTYPAQSLNRRQISTTMTRILVVGLFEVVVRESNEFRELREISVYSQISLKFPKTLCPLPETLGLLSSLSLFAPLLTASCAEDTPCRTTSMLFCPYS